MRGKTEFDLDSDPPPDLALEIEVTESALPRMKIYAALQVGEVWRFNGNSLRVSLLGANGKYKESSTSGVFPFLPIKEIERFLVKSTSTDETSLVRQFAKWVRETIVPKLEAGKPKKNGKKSRK